VPQRRSERGIAEKRPSPTMIEPGNPYSHRAVTVSANINLQAITDDCWCDDSRSASPETSSAYSIISLICSVLAGFLDYFSPFSSKCNLLGVKIGRKCQSQPAMCCSALHCLMLSSFSLLLLLLLLLLLFVIAFIQRIYNYIPGTNYGSSLYNVTATMWLHFMVHVMFFTVTSVLYFYINTSRSMCAVPSICCFM
jgi:hypothetical protein